MTTITPSPVYSDSYVLTQLGGGAPTDAAALESSSHGMSDELSAYLGQVSAGAPADPFPLIDKFDELYTQLKLLPPEQLTEEMQTSISRFEKLLGEAAEASDTEGYSPQFLEALNALKAASPEALSALREAVAAVLTDNADLAAGATQADRIFAALLALLLTGKELRSVFRDMGNAQAIAKMDASYKAANETEDAGQSEADQMRTSAAGSITGGTVSIAASGAAAHSTKQGSESGLQAEIHNPRNNGAPQVNQDYQTHTRAAASHDAKSKLFMGASQGGGSIFTGSTEAAAATEAEERAKRQAESQRFQANADVQGAASQTSQTTAEAINKALQDSVDLMKAQQQQETDSEMNSGRNIAA